MLHAYTHLLHAVHAYHVLFPALYRHWFRSLAREHSTGSVDNPARNHPTGGAELRSVVDGHRRQPGKATGRRVLCGGAPRSVGHIV